MSKGLKIALIIGAAVAAFFLLKKTASATAGTSPTGVQKVSGGIAGLVAAAGKAVKTLGGAVGIGAATTTVIATPLVSGVAPAYALAGAPMVPGAASITTSASAPISGAAAGTGGFGATAATVGGFAAAAFVVVSFFKTLFGNAGTPDFQGIQLKTPVQEDGEKIMEGIESVRVLRGAVG
jgi:hypothetical protein